MLSTIFDESYSLDPGKNLDLKLKPVSADHIGHTPVAEEHVTLEIDQTAFFGGNPAVPRSWFVGKLDEVDEHSFLLSSSPWDLNSWESLQEVT